MARPSCRIRLLFSDFDTDSYSYKTADSDSTQRGAELLENMK